MNQKVMHHKVKAVVADDAKNPYWVTVDFGADEIRVRTEEQPRVGDMIRVTHEWNLDEPEPETPAAALRLVDAA